MTSSRKKYINTDAGGDKLLSLDNEKKQILNDDALAKEKAQISRNPAPKGRHAMLRSLDFFEKTRIEA